MKTVEDVVRVLKSVEKRLNKISSGQARYAAYEASVCTARIKKIIKAIEGKE